MSTTPKSIPEHSAYEEQRERRQEAIARHGRQQAELFEDEHQYPECPTCGEHGRPVYGRSYDPDTGYDAEEIGCALCVPLGC